MTARAELQGCCDNDVKQSNYWTTVGVTAASDLQESCQICSEFG